MSSASIGYRRYFGAIPRGAWIIGGILLIALSLLFGARLLIDQRIRADVRSARRAIAARRYADANAAIDRWLAHRPDSAEARYLKARAAYGLGQYSAVETELAKAESLGYPKTHTDRLRAFLLVLAGRFAEAEPILIRILSASRAPDPEADEALARVFLQSYKLKPAAQVLDRWIRDAPNDPTPFVWYTEIDRRMEQDQTRAIGHFRSALRLDPNLDKARLGLADVLRLAHRNEEAETEYSAYLARKPRDPSGHVGAGLNALARGDLATAGKHLDRALEIAPDDLSALKERAALDVRVNRFAAALARLDRAAALSPLDTEVMYRRRIVLGRLGRPEDAAAVQRQLDRFREDEAQLNKIRERLNDEPSNVELRFEIAHWMFDHGQAEEGLKWAKTVLTAQPGHAPTNELLAGHYQRTGNTGLANYYRLQAASDSTRARK